MLPEYGTGLLPKAMNKSASVLTFLLPVPITVEYRDEVGMGVPRNVGSDSFGAPTIELDTHPNDYFSVIFQLRSIHDVVLIDRIE